MGSRHATTERLNGLRLRMHAELSSVLEVGRQLLGMDRALLSDLGSPEVVLVVGVGGRLEPSTEVDRQCLSCAAAAADRVLLGDLATSRDAPRLAGVGALVGQPSRGEGELLGAVAFTSARAVALDERHTALLDLVGRLVSSLLARLRMEERLRRSEQRLRRVFMQSLVGMAMVREDGRWGEVNDQLCAILGREREDLAERAWWDDTHPEDVAREEALFAGTLSGERDGYALEKRFLGPDGTEIHASVSARVLRTSGGGLDCLITLVQDISGRKAAEEEGRRLQAQLLEAQKHESLGVLAAGIAHDFNNLLTAIAGNAHLARGELEAGSNAARAVDTTIAAAGRAAALTRQLLAYAGKTTHLPRPLDLSECVREMGPLLISAIPKKVELRLDLGLNLPTVLADETQLQQVVMNLVMNGAEAIGDAAGTVRVSTGSRHISPDVARDRQLRGEARPGRYVYLAVTDSGCGMPASHVARVFDPFFTTKFTGRGLGLASVLGIVQANDGLVGLSTEEGQGTTFEVFLPAGVREETQVSEEPRGVPRVLIVDDEEIVRDFCRATLDGAGFQTRLAAGGSEALELLRQEPGAADVVVLDVTMPVLDGLETLDAMWRLRPGLPVLLCSGLGESGLSRRAPPGPMAFLDKPFSPGELVKAVWALLEGSALGSQRMPTGGWRRGAEGEGAAG